MGVTYTVRRLAVILLACLLAGCGSRPAPELPPAPVAPAPVVAAPAPAATPAPAPPVSAPGLQSGLSRDENRDRLAEWLISPQANPAEQLDQSWVAADLDGNGESEYVTVQTVTDDRGRMAPGAALFVIYRKDGRWAVDRTDPMPERVELELMQPKLYGVTDIAGAGHPQVVWGRPELIATGPQPNYIFVTAWQPGRFTQLPGTVALSNAKVVIDGKAIVLTGVSRRNTYLPVMQRTDRYRVVDGALRRVDRTFAAHPEDGYARLWDGLVAEDSGRLADAETAYREAADPARKPHSGSIEGYHRLPRELSDAEMAQFGAALRALARFRLGALLLSSGRRDQAPPADGPFAGLAETMRTAAGREAGCKAGQAWAAAHPEFLEAFNVGVGTEQWTPAVICSHIDIDDHGPWEE